MNTETEVKQEKKVVHKKDRHENNKIPNFEDFFQGQPTQIGKKRGKGFMLQLLKKDRTPILWSCIIYLFQNAPAWVLPLVTSDVIDIITVRPDNMLIRLIIDAIICVVLLVQNIPLTIWRSNMLNKMVNS